jgi:hypothetical protein
MQKASGEDEIDAIVGAALKAMVESGAGRAHVGSFAASFREEVSEILGRKPKAPEAPDLLALVTQAVKTAMADPSINPVVRSTRKRGAVKMYVTVQGRRTSVSMPADLVTGLDEVTGGRRQTATLVEQLAQSAPHDVPNRSRWIHERARAYAEKAGPSLSRH